MHPTRTAALVLLAAALVPAARAGDTLTKAQVIARGSVICRAAERKVDALPQIRSEHPFARNAPAGEPQRAIVFLDGYADALAGVRRGLGTLAAPPRGRALLEGFVADLGPAVAAFRRAHDDAVAGRFAAAESEAARAFALFEEASRKTAAYGFPKGVCQSG